LRFVVWRRKRTAFPTKKRSHIKNAKKNEEKKLTQRAQVEGVFEKFKITSPEK